MVEVDLFDSLPEGVLTRILELVKCANTICTLGCTCRRLRSLCYDETLWKQLFIDTFPQSQEAACDSGNVRRDRWRQRYIEKAMVEYNWATDNFTSTRFYGHRGPTTTLYSAHEKLYADSQDNSACVWDARSGKLLQRIRVAPWQSQHPASVRCIGVLDLGPPHAAECPKCTADHRWVHWVQLGDAHFMMRLVLLIVLMPIATFLEPRGSAHALELLVYFLSLRDAFFDAFLDELRGGLLLFAISTQRQTQPRTEGKGEPHIVVGCTDGTVRVFCPGVDTGGKVIGTHLGRVPVGCLEVSEELGTFLTGAEDGSIQAWDVPHCKHTPSGDPMLWRRTEHRNEAVVRLKVVPYSDIFVSSAGDSVCLVWALKSGTLLAAFVGHQRPVEHLVLLPMGPLTWVLSGGRDEAAVRLWQLDEGALAVHRTRQNRYMAALQSLRVFEGHRAGVTCLAANGMRAVSGSRDGTARVWDVNTGECLAVLGFRAGRSHRSHASTISGVSFQDERLIVCDLNGRLLFWDTKTFRKLHCNIPETTGSIWAMIATEARIVVSTSASEIIAFDFSGPPCKTLRKVQGLMMTAMPHDCCDHATGAPP